MASDNEYVNFEEYYEIRDWLLRKSYSGSNPNQERLKKISSKIKQLFNKTSSEHLTWGELDFFHNEFPSFFVDFEKKS